MNPLELQPALELFWGVSCIILYKMFIYFPFNGLDTSPSDGLLSADGVQGEPVHETLKFSKRSLCQRLSTSSTALSMLWPVMLVALTFAHGWRGIS